MIVSEVNGLVENLKTRHSKVWTPVLEAQESIICEHVKQLALVLVFGVYEDADAEGKFVGIFQSVMESVDTLQAGAVDLLDERIQDLT